MIDSPILISISILMGSIFAALIISRALLVAARSIEPTIVIEHRGPSPIEMPSPVDEPKVENQGSFDMDGGLTSIQARAFEEPPRVSRRDGGSVIDLGDDIRSSANEISRKLRER